MPWNNKEGYSHSMMYMMKRLLNVGACLLLLTSASSAGSVLLYDNLDPGGGGDSMGASAPIGNGNSGMGIPGIGPLADSFSTGSNAGILSEVELQLQLVGNATGSITVYLYSDSSTSPGTSLYTLGTIMDSAVSLTGTPPVDLSGLSYSLAANTRYWIYVADSNPAGPGTSLWWVAESTNAGMGTPGVANEYSFTAQASPQVLANNAYANFGTGPYEMSVTMNTIPEPSSVVLLGAGLAGGVIAFGRLKKPRRAAN
jgi:hypothetical protein